jgi:hypothetical protein
LFSTTSGLSKKAWNGSNSARRGVSQHWNQKVKIASFVQVGPGSTNGRRSPRQIHMLIVAWALPGGSRPQLRPGRCNSQKRDRLPPCDHLETWVERNSKYRGKWRMPCASAESWRIGRVEARHAMGVRTDRSGGRVDVVAGRSDDALGFFMASVL